MADSIPPPTPETPDSSRDPALLTPMTPDPAADPSALAPTTPNAAADPTARPPTPAGPYARTDRVWTVPNLLSVLRLLGVPLFLWLLLGPQSDGWALAVLIVSAMTDWLDGKLARLLDQYSKLGELLDPAADRLYIVAALVGFVIRGFIPWWVAALIVGRDVVLAATLPLLRRYGYTALPVHYLGKAATFVLLYGLPMLLLAQLGETLNDIALPISYAFIAWGVVLYLWAGAVYLGQIRWIVKNRPVVAREHRPPARSAASG